MNSEQFISTFFASLISSSITIAICLFIFKTWFNRKIESHFKISEDIAKTLLDIEKTKAINIQDKLITIYPELLEVTYRLRNSLREINNGLRKINNDFADDILLERKGFLEREKFKKALFLLTENLYKYRAFVSDDVFKNLHDFKRNLQDASVIIDILTRATTSTLIDQYPDSLTSRLNEIYSETNLLYETIKNEIQTTLKSHLPHS